MHFCIAGLVATNLRTLSSQLSEQLKPGPQLDESTTTDSHKQMAMPQHYGPITTQAHTAGSDPCVLVGSLVGSWLLER